jgi:hypothetical protein
MPRQSRGRINPSETPGREPPSPPEYEGLSDGDIGDGIRDSLRELGGDALSRLTVEVRDGRVILGGEIPSEARRTVALQIVDDIVDLPVEDRMRVTVGWETSERSMPPPPDTPELDRAEGVESLNEDPMRAEGGEIYDPPIKPVPEDE